jgi:hypothetical protein
VCDDDDECKLAPELRDVFGQLLALSEFGNGLHQSASKSTSTSTLATNMFIGNRPSKHVAHGQNVAIRRAFFKLAKIAVIRAGFIVSEHLSQIRKARAER